MGDEKKSGCGEIPIGVTIDKRELDIAGATILEFSLGKLVIKDTPQFEKIISEVASNFAATDIVACKTIERAGARNNAKMVDYFTREIHFLAGRPSTSEQIQWQQSNPFPNAAQQEQSRPTHREFGATAEIEIDPSLARSCKQPTVGLRRQPEFFVSIWVHFLRQLKAEKFPQDRDLNSLYHIKGRYRDPYNNPEDLFPESLYTLKCLEDRGELKLEKLGTTGKFQDKVFENQKIVFQ